MIIINAFPFKIDCVANLVQQRSDGVVGDLFLVERGKGVAVGQLQEGYLMILGSDVGFGEKSLTMISGVVILLMNDLLCIITSNKPATDSEQSVFNAYYLSYGLH